MHRPPARPRPLPRRHFCTPVTHDPYDDPRDTLEFVTEMTNRERLACLESAATGLEYDPDDNDAEPDALTSDHPGRTGP